MITYNHTAGTIDVRLESGSIASFTKHNVQLLIPLLNMQSMAPKLFKLPLTQSKIMEMVERFYENGGKVTKAPDPVPADLKLKDLGPLDLTGLTL